MTPQQAQFDADVAAVEGDALMFFLFKGKQYIGQRTPVVDMLQMEDAGWHQKFDCTLEVRTSQFPGGNEIPPAHNDEIQEQIQQPNGSFNNGNTYRVVSVTPDQLGVVNHYALKEI